MSQSSDTAVSRILAFLRHPVTLLFLGALCTYWLVPVLTHNRLLQEARIMEGRKIFEYAVLTDKQLISLRTALEAFHKEASSDPKKFKAQQDDLRKSSYQNGLNTGQMTIHLDTTRKSWHSLPGIARQQKYMV